MPQYQKRPVEIEAEKFIGRPSTEGLGHFPLSAVFEAAVCYRPDRTLAERDLLKVEGYEVRPHIHTLEGFHEVTDQDWIIRGVKGEFYPCKPDIFAQTYEQVVEQTTFAGPAIRSLRCLIHNVIHTTAPCSECEAAKAVPA